MHLLRNPAQAGLKPSLPCVKGGGTACRDGGIVKSDNLHKTIPQSASLTAPFTQGSLWHKVILRWIFICFLLIGNSLFWTTRLSRDFRFTTNHSTSMLSGIFIKQAYIFINATSLLFSSICMRFVMGRFVNLMIFFLIIHLVIPNIPCHHIWHPL